MAAVPSAAFSSVSRSGHRRRIRRALLALSLTGLLGGTPAVAAGPLPAPDTPEAPETIRLATLDWPPYTSARPQPGSLQTVVRAALSASGITLSSTVLPWRRAIRVGLKDPGFHGYFPEYASPQMNGLCLLSDPIGQGPLGLVHRVDTPVRWSTLHDLKGVRLGVVQDYINTDALDALLRLGELQAETAMDDATNLRKVLGRRIDAAVIDLAVFHFLIQSEADLRPSADLLVASPQSLEMKTLHVCFRPTAEGERLRDRFNAGLNTLHMSPFSQPTR